MLNTFLKEWYVLNKTQRRGTVVLIALIILTICVKIFYLPKVDDDALYFANLTVQNKLATQSTIHHLQSIHSKKDTLFFFNPNIVTEEEMKMLGLPISLIKNIINYRKAGGKFYTRESLKKLYAMTDSVYQIISPYVVIDNKTSQSTSCLSVTSHSSSSQKVITIELNTADSIELEHLYGIGKILAARIVKYRNKLGGYCALEQLKEVYGIKDSLYNIIVRKNKIQIDTQYIQKINLNTVDFKTMIKHPYFNKDMIIQILEIRKRKETFSAQKLEEIIGKEAWNKVRYYIEY